MIRGLSKTCAAPKGLRITRPLGHFRITPLRGKQFCGKTLDRRLPGFA
jgi:hypothetical protein